MRRHPARSLAIREEFSGHRLQPRIMRHPLERRILIQSQSAAGETSMQPICLIVNGSTVSVTTGEETPLLDILRNHLGLTGTKFGCGLEQCGCCMVLVDGKPEKSCTKPVSTLAGRGIVTIEGLGTPDRPHPLQQAFLDEQAGQCGYCLPGILVSAKALDDNICRCGSHNRILRAVERAAALLREGAAR